LNIHYVVTICEVRRHCFESFDLFLKFCILLCIHLLLHHTIKSSLQVKEQGKSEYGNTIVVNIGCRPLARASSVVGYVYICQYHYYIISLGGTNLLINGSVFSPLYVLHVGLFAEYSTLCIAKEKLTAAS